VNLRQLTASELSQILVVYQACEDFLALGPESVASKQMVLADLARSLDIGGSYNGIFDPVGIFSESSILSRLDSRDRTTRHSLNCL